MLQKMHNMGGLTIAVGKFTGRVSSAAGSGGPLAPSMRSRKSLDHICCSVMLGRTKVNMLPPGSAPGLTHSCQVWTTNSDDSTDSELLPGLALSFELSIITCC